MRVHTLHLAAYTILTDVFIAAAVVPCELYCRGAVASHLGNKPFLFALLGANAALMAVMVGAMYASAVLLGRAAKRTAWLLGRRSVLDSLRSDPDRLNVDELMQAEG